MRFFASLMLSRTWMPFPRFRPVGLRIQILLPAKWHCGITRGWSDLSLNYLAVPSSDSPNTFCDFDESVNVTISSLCLLSNLNTYLNGFNSADNIFVSTSPLLSIGILRQKVRGSILLKTETEFSSCHFVIFLNNLFFVVISAWPSKWFTICENKFWLIRSKLMPLETGAHRKWKWDMGC
jgi:hypothetical protein